MTMFPFPRTPSPPGRTNGNSATGRRGESAPYTDPLVVEASDPTTDPERLKTIAAQYANESVRAAVAGNPNTPPDVLISLAPDFIDAFLKNPVAPLLPLEMPDLLDSLSRVTLQKMLRSGALPGSYARVLSRHPDTGLAGRGTGIAALAVRHVAMAGELDPDDPTWEDDTLAELNALPLGDPGPFRTLVNLGVAPEWLIARLPPEPVVFGAPQVVGTKFSLVGSIRTTLMRYLQFAHCRLTLREADTGSVSPTPLFRLGVAINPDTLDSLREFLAEDGDRYVRAAARARIRYPGRVFRV